jgi:hypothetical protein
MAFIKNLPPSPQALNFGYAEHLLVWSWRRMATGRGHCQFIDREFGEACGENAREVFATFVTFLEALAYASRRQMVLGHPGYLGLTADERQVLTLLAALQNRRLALFDAHLAWLSKPDRRQTLSIGAGALAAALSANDLHLTVPNAVAPTRCDRQIAVA